MIPEYPQQLYDAMSKLQLTFLECHKLIGLSEQVQTAAWCYNARSKEEKILFNPSFLEGLNAAECEVVIRHGIQHKALFKELGRMDLDRELLNVALDIAISKVFSRSCDALEYKAFCNKFYGADENTLHTVLALAWYGLDPNRIRNLEVRRYYKELWKLPKDPSPLEIYYRLQEISGYQKLLPKKGCASVDLDGKDDNGPRRPGDLHEKGPGGMDKEVFVRGIPGADLEGMEEDNIENRVLGEGPAAGAMRQWLKALQIEKEVFEVGAIEEFISRIQSVEALDRTAGRIESLIHKETRRQLYPLRPSRLGHVYILTGISQLLRQYWNKVSSRHIARLNVYVDVSPSMERFREKEVFLIDRLKDFFPGTFYIFGTKVMEFMVRDFASGKYPCGSGTDFDPVVEHLMGSVVECAVVFTDGQAEISPKNRLRFLRSGKRLFTVYFNDQWELRKNGPEPIRSDLDDISELVMQLDLFEHHSSLIHRICL